MPNSVSWSIRSMCTYRIRFIELDSFCSRASTPSNGRARAQYSPIFSGGLTTLDRMEQMCNICHQLNFFSLQLSDVPLSLAIQLSRVGSLCTDERLLELDLSAETNLQSRKRDDITLNSTWHPKKSNQATSCLSYPHLSFSPNLSLEQRLLFHHLHTGQLFEH